MRNVYRLVLDTNVVISAFLWCGTPNQLLHAVINGQCNLYTCQEMLVELRTVLQRSKFIPKLHAYGSTPDQLTHYFAILARQIQLVHPVPPVTGDPADDAVLACGLSANADFIVTGDADLLTIACHHNVPVISPRMALNRIGAYP